MPAERTKKIESPVSSPLAWAETETPETKSAAFAFAPNITPSSFTDPLSEAGPSSAPTQESLLFPPEDGLSFGASPAMPTKRRVAHSRRKGADHIPRPPNAFILFRSSFIKSQAVTAAVETNHSTLSKIIGLTWQNLPPEERNIWHQKAKTALEEHKRRWPTYAFKPAAGASKAARASSTLADGKPMKIEKRKLKEVAPKDMVRCAKIAELLCEGKKGADLDAAIEEFDRTHVAPAIEHRFETPLTVRAYRRSSSAPAIAEAGEQLRFLAQPTEANSSAPPAVSTKRSSSAGPAEAAALSMPPPPPPVALEFNMNMFASAPPMSFDPPPPAFTFNQYTMPATPVDPLVPGPLEPSPMGNSFLPAAVDDSGMPPLVERPFDPLTDLPEGFLPPSSPSYATPTFASEVNGASFSTSFGTPFSVPESAYEFPAYAPPELAQHGPHVFPRLSINTLALLEQIAGESMPSSATSPPPSAASVDGSWPWSPTSATSSEPMFLPSSPTAYAPSPAQVLSFAVSPPPAKTEPFSPTLTTSFTLPPSKVDAPAFRVNVDFSISQDAAATSKVAEPSPLDLGALLNGPQYVF